MARPFASPLFRGLAGGGSFFRSFPFRWALQLALSLARCLTYTGRSTLLWERFSVRMRSPTRHLVVPVLHCPVASAKSIYIDAGTANQRSRFDLPQDDADQVRYMLTSGPHVP